MESPHLLKQLRAKLAPSQKARRAVFLHIQKTAGTSIIQSVANHYRGSWVSHLDYSERSPEEMRTKGFISGHFGYDYTSQWMRDRYSFTFLRSPEDRIVSFYYYCRGCSPSQYEVYQMAQDFTLDAFLDLGMTDWRVRPDVWNHQTWQIALGWGNRHNKRLYEFREDELIARALKNLKTFDYVGLTECFDADCGEIFASLGIPYSRPANKVNAAQRPSVSRLPDSTIEKLRNLTTLVRVLYEEVYRDRGLCP